MKSKHILLSTTGAGILLTGVLYFAPSQPKHEGVKLVRDTTTARTADMISPFGAMGASGIQNISPKIAQDMSTNIDVSDIADSDIATIIALQKFEQEQPEVYKRAQESPLWNRGPQGKESILYGRLELLMSLSLRLDQLDANPGIEQ